MQPLTSFFFFLPQDFFSTELVQFMVFQTLSSIRCINGKKVCDDVCWCEIKAIQEIGNQSHRKQIACFSGADTASWLHLISKVLLIRSDY